MQLSEHFNLAELTRSQTATRRGLDNTPPPAAVDALRALCVHVLEPLRQLLGRPIAISSGYRSPALNHAVGGSRNSQHLRGEAVDLTVLGLTPQQVFDLIRASDLPFDQLILEFGTWVHISHAHARKQRQECLIAHRTAQGVKYVQTSRRPAPRQTQTIPVAPVIAAPPLFDAPNDEFGTVSKLIPPPPPPPTRLDPGYPAHRGAAPGLSFWLTNLQDRLFGSGAGQTGFAVSLLALAGWWNELAVVLQATGITLPQNKGQWAALGLAVLKFVISKGSK